MITMRTKDAPIATRVVKYEAGKHGARSHLIVTTNSVRLPINRMVVSKRLCIWLRSSRGISVSGSKKLSGGNSTKQKPLEEATRKKTVIKRPVALTASAARKKNKDADNAKSDGTAGIELCKLQADALIVEGRGH